MADNDHTDLPKFHVETPGGEPLSTDTRRMGASFAPHVISAQAGAAWALSDRNVARADAQMDPADIAAIDETMMRRGPEMKAGHFTSTRALTSAAVSALAADAINKAKGR